MSLVLAEAFGRVISSDVHDYGSLDFVGSFVGEGADVARWPTDGVGLIPIDWVITNPPFNLAEQFVERALRVARKGVAVLVRSAWLEGGGRWERVFSRVPPQAVLQFQGVCRWWPGVGTPRRARRRATRGWSGLAMSRALSARGCTGLRLTRSAV